MTPYQKTFPEHERRTAPPGMTTEQLDYFTEQTVKAVEKGTKKGVRHYRNNAIIGFLLLLFGLGYVQWRAMESAVESRDAIVKSGRVVSVSGCNRDYRSLTALRGTLKASRRFTVNAGKQGVIGPSEVATRLAFYDAQLDRLRLPDCRVAAKVVTDDPKDIGDVPVPLHPPDTGDDATERPPGAKNP